MPSSALHRQKRGGKRGTRAGGKSITPRRHVLPTLLSGIGSAGLVLLNAMLELLRESKRACTSASHIVLKESLAGIFS